MTNYEVWVADVLPPILQNKTVKPRYSFCTTCGNRLLFLERTLPVNINLAIKHDSEIILLDYNSKDGVQQYIKDNYQYAIDNQSLIYVHEKTAKRFFMAHAKNAATRFAQGDIVTNLDADNFLTEEFFEQSSEAFGTKTDIFVRHYGSGRLSFRRDDIFKLTGYDESMKAGWGHDDNDLCHRSERLGLKQIQFLLKDTDIAEKYILKHDDILRAEGNLAGCASKKESEQLNELSMIRNHRYGLKAVNKSGFGRGTYYVNFSSEPIIVK